MLIINLAPVDQSGRTLMLAEKCAKEGERVTLVCYRGVRKPEMLSQRIDTVFVKNIRTQGRVLGFRAWLLFLKFFYLSAKCTQMVVKEYLQRRKERSDAAEIEMRRVGVFGGKDALEKSEAGWQKGLSVMFVVPPTPTVVFPMAVAKILGMRVVLDWHRPTEGLIRHLNLALAKFSENVTVTFEMQKYFENRSVSRVRVVKDVDLANLAVSEKPRAKIDRKALFQQLQKKYPEYQERLASVDPERRIAVCSTSFSKEEKIEELLEAAANIGAKATLILTTKTAIEVPRTSLNIVQVFLDYKDYTSILRAADFGISTHRCYYDFPLKIVDYLKNGLPVIAHASTPHNILPAGAPVERYADKQELQRLLERYYTGEEVCQIGQVS